MLSVISTTQSCWPPNWPGKTPDALGIRYFERELGASEQLIIDMLSTVGKMGVDIAGLVPQRSSAQQRLLALVNGSMSPLMRLNDPRGVYAHCFCDAAIN